MLSSLSTVDNLHCLPIDKEKTKNLNFLEVKEVKAILDSGASDNYIRPEDQRVIVDVMNETGPTVMLPDS